ncbi:hypothetical protein LTR84_007309 [Exophiala bonariae]|uniref:Clr5 domain-containing protein n=1 Tax=Exophiala bonariae TaxID=1690606 RepID=A0AAV9N094_9EURO|nr:hypothetical protein LTR84_007309 [Exophiala bonariae]
MPIARGHTSVQTFDSRYIDRSRLETLLKALHKDSEYTVKRQLNTWKVEAPQPLESRQIEALRR